MTDSPLVFLNTEHLGLTELYSIQVVAGTLFKFDLVLKHEEYPGGESCSISDGEEERCHVQVYDVPWEQKREVNWDLTTCTRN